jgi:hypothetical protein
MPSWERWVILTAAPRPYLEMDGRSHRGECIFRKADGRKRPLGIAALEGKIVQHAAGSSGSE